MLRTMFVPHWAILAVLVAAFAIGGGVTLVFFADGTSVAANQHTTVTVKIENAHVTANDLGPDPSATYFIVIGDITEVNGQPATGKWYCRGVYVDPEARGFPSLIDGTPDPDGVAFTTQRFLIDGKGTIIGVGNDGSDVPFAIVGGNGIFEGVTGQYSTAGSPIPFGTGTITAEFTLNLP